MTLDSAPSRPRRARCQRVAIWLLVTLLVYGWSTSARAVTYAHTATTYNWIDASTHNKLGPTVGGIYSPNYRFQNTGGCGTTPPVIDDTLTDNIPLGFTFMYGGQNFTHVRIMSNGRLQFNNNTTCGYGSPVTQLPYPNAGLDYTMRIYGGDLDPSLQSEIGSRYTTACTDRNVCYVSYATIGTAPHRSFVVTWNNVPEWTTSSATSGNYNLQVILQENGEFIYQYGNSTPGPGYTLGQVGWQVSNASGDYDIPAVGFPPAGTAIKFYIPRPIAEYRMEQPSWSGVTGEVLDTSGNGRHATAIVNGATTRPQDVATGKVCRGGQIADNSSVAEISAIDTNIAVPTVVGNSGTISFWYNNSSNDRMLFDASVVNNRWFYLRRNNNRSLTFTVTDSGNTHRSVTTAAGVVPDSGWSHIVVSWTFNNLAGSNQDRLRIWVNGVLRQTSVFTTNSTLSPQIGTLYLGDNRSGISPLGRSAGNPGGTNATLDEFRIYNFEGGAALVSRDYNQADACLSHYAISHAGTGQACQTNNVTLTAHDASHASVIMPNNTTQITLSTSTGQGDWSLVSGYGVLDNGAVNDGIATYLWNGEYQAVFALNHPTPGTVNINVSDGQITEQEDPDLQLSSCVNVAAFNACHDHATSQCKAVGRLNTRLAGTTFATDVVALDSSGNPDSGFVGKAVVSLIARATPGAVDAQNCFIPTFTQVLDNAATFFAAGKLTVNATVTNAWRDVRIKVVCDSTNCPPAGITVCSTDNFAIRPPSFSVSSFNANADAGGGSTTATPTIKAGSSFSLTATAVPGYGGTPQIDSSKLVAHTGSVATGSLSGSFPAADPASGSATGTAFAYGEVGYFRFDPGGVYDAGFTAVDQPNDCSNDFSNTLVGGKYGCMIGNPVASGFFGRFIPDHFDTVATAACGSFTYSGQPFPLTVTAKNLGGGTTQNYAGAFAKTVTLSDANGATGAFTPASLAAGDFPAGEANKSVKFTFAGKPAAPATLKVRATDGEASSASGSEGSLPLRSGRLRLVNYYGSELLRPRVEYRVEYWDGSRWTVNAADTCTSLAAANIATGGLAAPSVGALSAGIGFITFNTAPAGSYDIAANLNAAGSDTSCNAAHGGTAANLPWLQGDWSASCGGIPPWQQDPSARVRLGSPKAPYIYLRERY